MAPRSTPSTIALATGAPPAVVEVCVPCPLLSRAVVYTSSPLPRCRCPGTPHRRSTCRCTRRGRWLRSAGCRRSCRPGLRHRPATAGRRFLGRDTRGAQARSRSRGYPRSRLRPRCVRAHCVVQRGRADELRTGVGQRLRQTIPLDGDDPGKREKVTCPVRGQGQSDAAIDDAQLGADHGAGNCRLQCSEEVTLDARDKGLVPACAWLPRSKGALVTEGLVAS